MRFFVSQTGRLRLHAFSVSLVCEEEATYRQGTDVRTEKRVVCEQLVFLKRSIQVEPAAPLRIEEDLVVSLGGDAYLSVRS